MPKLEAPSGNGPWMLRSPEDEWTKFSLKIESVVKDTNDRGWSCYTAQMKLIKMKGVEDGNHEIPFWAMEAFFDLYILLDEDDGWIGLRYRRSRSGDQNEAEFRVD